VYTCLAQCLGLYRLNESQYEYRVLSLKQLEKAPKILRARASLRGREPKEYLQVTHSVSTTLLKCFLSSNINHSDCCDCYESQLLSCDEVLRTAKILLALVHEAKQQISQVTKILHLGYRLVSLHAMSYVTDLKHSFT